MDRSSAPALVARVAALVVRLRRAPAVRPALVARVADLVARVAAPVVLRRVPVVLRRVPVVLRRVLVVLQRVLVVPRQVLVVPRRVPADLVVLRRALVELAERQRELAAPVAAPHWLPGARS